MTVLERIKDLIASELQLDAEQVTLDSNFVSDLGADELSFVELVMCVEEEFGIEIDDEEAEDLTTVKLFLDYVSSRVEKRTKEAHANFPPKAKSQEKS